MKNMTLFLFSFVMISTIAFANNEQPITNEYMQPTVFAANNRNPIIKYSVRKARGWNKIKGEWQDWNSTLTIYENSDGTLYLWEIGGVTSPVKVSDLNNYNYMVDEPERITRRSKVRYYFNARDLNFVKDLR